MTRPAGGDEQRRVEGVDQRRDLEGQFGVTFRRGARRPPVTTWFDWAAAATVMLTLLILVVLAAQLVSLNHQVRDLRDETARARAETAAADRLTSDRLCELVGRPAPRDVAALRRMKCLPDPPRAP